jgi:hypothetical protein
VYILSALTVFIVFVAGLVASGGVGGGGAERIRRLLYHFGSGARRHLHDRRTRHSINLMISDAVVDCCCAAPAIATAVAANHSSVNWFTSGT